MQVYHDFQRFLIRIRIRILANDTDPTGSGSETLVIRLTYFLKRKTWNDSGRGLDTMAFWKALGKLQKCFFV